MINKLAILTHVEHFCHRGKYFGYPPYIREMNIWMKFVSEVEVMGPAPQPSKGEFNNKDAYRHPKIKFTKIPSFNLLNFKSAFQAVLKIPVIFIKIAGAMNRAEHLHLRCPGNIGLLACLCQIFFPNKTKTAKYAGNWNPDAKQPWSYKLQRWILSNTFLTRNMTVLVYGEWPTQSKNILPFFTASFSEIEIEKIEKDFKAPYKFLFVGNLVPGKQPQLAIRLVEALKEKNIPVELHVYGDGVLKNELELQAGNKDYIHLHGNQPLDIVKQAYKDSHFLILASKSEGWPKAVAEAMFFGCIPIVTPVSCVPWMINYGSRGILIPEGRVVSGWRTEDTVKVDSGECREDSQHVLGETVAKIIELLKDPVEMRRMSMEAHVWSKEYTLEKFEKAIREILLKPDLINKI